MTEGMQMQPSAEMAGMRDEIAAISQVLLRQLQDMDKPVELGGEAPQALVDLGYVQDDAADLRPLMKEVSRSANMLTEPDFSRVLRKLYPEHCWKIGASDQGKDRDDALWWPFVELVAAAFIATGVSQDEMLDYLAKAYSELPEDASLLSAPIRTLAPDGLAEEADRLYTEKLWWKRDYSLARQCMMAPGAKPATDAMRNRLLDIYQTRDENERMLVCGAIFLVAEFLFTLVFGKNILTGHSMAGIATVAIIGSALLLALASRRFSRKPFNGLSGLVAAEFACWALFALAAILS